MSKHGPFLGIQELKPQFRAYKAWYRGRWGNDSPVLVTVVGVGTKNGRIVLDCDNGHWGYVNQFEPIDDK